MTNARRAGAMVALACLSTLMTFTAEAGPSDYAFTPIVKEGEREIDFKAGSSKFRDGTRANKESVGFGYGATSWWFTELYAIACPLSAACRLLRGLAVALRSTRFGSRHAGRHPKLIAEKLNLKLGFARAASRHCAQSTLSRHRPP